MTTPTGPDLCYALAARKKARYLSRMYDSRLASVGLSVSQYSILALLEAHGPLNLVDLSHKLLMDRTSLVRALKPLQTAECVLTERTDGRRAHQVRLTPLGLTAVAQATPLWATAQAEFEDEVGRNRAVRQRNDVLRLNLGG